MKGTARNLRRSIGIVGDRGPAFRESLRTLVTRASELPPAADPGLAIYKTDGIGDFILALPAIKALGKSVSKKMAVLVAEPSLELAKRELPDMEVHGFPAVWTGTPGDWRKAMSDALRFATTHRNWELLSLRHPLSIMDAAFFRMIAPSRSFGVTGSPLLVEPLPQDWKWNHTDVAEYPRERTEEFPHELLAHFEACSLVAGRPLAPQRPRLESFPRTHPVEQLVVFPTTRSRLRNYRIPQLAESICTAFENDPLPVIVCGTREEFVSLDELTELLQQRLPSVRRLNPSSAAEAADLIAQSTLVLGMDSAPAHITMGLDRPGVFLLAGGHHGYFAPYGNPTLHTWLSHPTPCYHCNWICQWPEPVCLTDIPPARIAEALVAVRRQHAAA
jgi:ADP-heptose:LPS heptosyltransferase